MGWLILLSGGCNVPKSLSDIQTSKVYRERFDYTLIGRAIVNTDFTFRNVNEQLCQYLGVTKAELIGRKFGDITPSPVKEIDEANARLLMEGKSHCYSMPKIYQISSNSPIVYVMLSVVGINQKDGAFDCFDVEVLKITEETYQKETKKLLEGYTQLQKKSRSWIITALLSMTTLSKKDWMQLIAALSGTIVAGKEVGRYIVEKFFTDAPPLP